MASAERQCLCLCTDISAKNRQFENSQWSGLIYFVNQMRTGKFVQFLTILNTWHLSHPLISVIDCQWRRKLAESCNRGSEWQWIVRRSLGRWGLQSILQPQSNTQVRKTCIHAAVKASSYGMDLRLCHTRCTWLFSALKHNFWWVVMTTNMIPDMLRVWI